MDWQTQHERMIADLRRYKIQDERVMAAMAKVRRHRFIPEELRDHVDPYGDHPCPIGHGQTISQPFIVAYMTQRLQVEPGSKVLEIGTGSGYQAAILSALGAKVFSIERIPELAEHARRVLAEEDCEKVHLKCDDGYAGWPEHAPYDAIVGTCSPRAVPEQVAAQLKDGGRMILPVGVAMQQLVVLEKKGNRLRKIPDMYVRFVPMVKGRA